MGPKKKAAKKDAGDDDEYNGPNLYLEFASKNPVEIANRHEAAEGKDVKRK